MKVIKFTTGRYAGKYAVVKNESHGLVAAHPKENYFIKLDHPDLNKCLFDRLEDAIEMHQNQKVDYGSFITICA